MLLFAGVIILRPTVLTSIYIFQDPRSFSHQGSYGSLPRSARIAVPPEAPPSGHSPYGPQPIVTRVNMPPASSLPRQSRRIPISVILRLQNPQYGQVATRQNPTMEGQVDFAHYRLPEAAPREFLPPASYHQRPPPPELRQPAVYSDGKTLLYVEKLHEFWGCTDTRADPNR